MGGFIMTGYQLSGWRKFSPEHMTSRLHSFSRENEKMQDTLRVLWGLCGKQVHKNFNYVNISINCAEYNFEIGDRKFRIIESLKYII